MRKRLVVLTVLALTGAAAPAVLAPPAFAVGVTCAQLPAALATASTGDVLSLTEPACSLDGLVINPGSEITLEGAPTVITDPDRENGVRILAGQDNGDSTFRNLTFTGGSQHFDVSNYGGGGVALTGTAVSPTFDTVMFTDNTATMPGGSLFVETQGHITDATVSADVSAAAAGDDPITIVNSTIENSSSDSIGGGAYISAPGESVQVLTTTVSGNDALFAGGGMFITVSRSAPDGAPNPTLVMAASRFSGNVATYEGGGLLAETGGGPMLVAAGFEAASHRPPTLSLSDNVFEDNQAIQGGGALIETDDVQDSVLLDGNRFSGNRSGPGVDDDCCVFQGAGLSIEGRVFVFDPEAETSIPVPTPVDQIGNRFDGNEILTSETAFVYTGGGAFYQNVDVRSRDDRYVNNIVPSVSALPEPAGEPAVAAEGESENRGGGFTVSGAIFVGENLVVAGNTIGAGGQGAGIYLATEQGGIRRASTQQVEHGDLTPTAVHLLDSTVAGNVVGEGGSPGIAGGGMAPGPESVTTTVAVTNSIVAGNTGDQPDITGTTFADVVFSDVCGGVGLTGGPWPGAGNICADPLLVNPAPGTADVHQTSGSPTIDRGDNALVPDDLTTDYEGQPRIADGDGDSAAVVDMGADESPAVVPGPGPGPGPGPVTCPGPEWFLAEGTTRPGFDEYILLFNTSTSPTTVQVTYAVDPTTGANVTRSHSVDGQARLTIPVFDAANLGRGADGNGIDHGTLIEAGTPVLVERTIYVNTTVAGIAVNGDHNVIAEPASRAAWYFAEGTSQTDFQTYFTVANPTATDTVVSATYGLEDGTVVERSKALPAFSRITIDANSVAEGVGPGVVGFSTVLSATVPVLAERPVYFDHPFPFADGDVGVNGATGSFGTSPSQSWYLAEGNVLPDFAMFLTLGNPGPATSATITYNLEGEAPISKAVALDATSRKTVQVFNAADPAGIGRAVSDPVSRGVGVHVSTSAPAGIVVERPMYFGRSFDPALVDIFDGHTTAGHPGFENVWYFAEGTGRPDFRTFLTLANPQTVDATVEITYFPDPSSSPGVPVTTRTVVVPAGQRKTIQTYGPAADGGHGQGEIDFAIRVSSDQPILAERPLYEDHAFPDIGTVNGGNVSIGLPDACVGAFS